MLLITGANSFVGKNLIQELEKRKIKYIGVDNDVKESRNIKKFDIRDPKIEKYVNSKTTIIHLAALSTDKQCQDNLDLAFDVNINGTINLINISNKKNAKKFIFASTEWVYGNYTKKIQKEDDEIIISELNSFYALSKAIGEKLILNKKNNFIKIILRFGIIYGNKEKNFSAFESLFLNCIKNNTIEVGSKNTSRRFIHVFDIVSGILIMLNYKKNNIFNLTGSKDITLEDIIRESSIILNKKTKIIEVSPNNISKRIPSNYKIKKETRWKQKINLKNGLNKLKNFYFH